MATNLNNMHINSFTKGMNTDTSFDQIGNEQYIFGKNIRITTNALLSAAAKATSKEGIIVPVGEVSEGSVECVYAEGFTLLKIIGSASIGNVGVFVVLRLSSSNENEYGWDLFRIIKTETEFKIRKILGTWDEDLTPDQTFSLVMNKENGDVTKVYIADGKHPIIAINIYEIEKYDDDDDFDYSALDIERFQSSVFFPKTLTKILKKISGSLKTSQVLYTYRFYKKNGVCSRLAPVSNKIQVIDSNRNKEQGNAEDTETSIGFLLGIDIDETIITAFDHILIYRVSYLKPNTDAEVSLIHDVKINIDMSVFKKDGIDSYCLQISDEGKNELQTLSIEELASLDSIVIKADSIEQNQGYMFAANIEDDTVFDIDVDTKTYSMNENGEYVYYKNSDTLYSSSKSFKTLKELLDYNKNNPSDLYILNRYVNHFQWGYNYSNPCRYKKYGTDLDGNVLYSIGGEGDFISWELVSGAISAEGKDKDLTECGVYPLVLHTNNKGEEYFEYGVKGACSLSDYMISHGIEDTFSAKYDDIYISSLFRSLRRDETYRYGIIFYDYNGRRTNVKWIADIRTPDENEFSTTGYHSDSYDNARPIGIKFKVDFDKLPKNLADEIHGYQIVRCAKTDSFTKNLMQCLVARPVNQRLYGGNPPTVDKYSPYYPSFILTSAYQTIHNYQALCRYGTPPYFYDSSDYSDGNYYYMYATSERNDSLFLIFSPEIQLVLNDALNKIQTSNIKISPIYYSFGITTDDENKQLNGGKEKIEAFDEDTYDLTYPQYAFTKSEIGSGDLSDKQIYVFKTMLKDAGYGPYREYNKQESSTLVERFRHQPYENYGYYLNVKTVKNPANPTWEQGFSNIQLSGSLITSGIKLYKSFSTSIGNKEYNNWASSGMYDMKISNDMSQAGYTENGTASLITGDTSRVFSHGWIGPGPKCFIINTEEDNGDVKVLQPNKLVVTDVYKNLYFYNTICNIQHNPTHYAGLTQENMQYDTYYGFGNYTKKSNSTYYVFDGDTYIVPCDFISMYKTYDFNSKDTIPSSQIIYRVLMETPINTFFDYGMNYRNTNSKNVQLEPGEITGVATQDRPEHQYNMVYSDNNISNDIYVPESLERSVNKYTQRIYYSEHKDNGENIDSWLIFKPINYIDADTRYGDITHLLTNKDVLYFWQEQAFGKLSVNERSLVTDNNSNTIQLGQGGVLLRTDYINTRYGMRSQDRAAIAAEGVIYWIDIMNKAIVMSNGLSAINYSEQTNVQSLVNERMSEDIPSVYYDMQNNEVVCKCLNNGEQIVFNIKLNVATSVYDKEYVGSIMLNNIIYGITLTQDKIWCYANMHKHNHILNTEKVDYKHTEILFVVNPATSVNKVFDNQQVVTVNGIKLNENFFENKEYKFQTNITGEVNNQPENADILEGSIEYTIPRSTNESYGSRMRGRWMTESIIDKDPSEDHAISHIITKFRQSVS